MIDNIVDAFRIVIGFIGVGMGGFSGSIALGLWLGPMIGWWAVIPSLLCVSIALGLATWVMGV